MAGANQDTGITSDMNLGMRISSTIKSQRNQSKSTRETIQVFVLSLLNKTVTLDVMLSDSIFQVKAKLDAKTTVPSSLYRLAFEGKILKDYASLRDYNVRQHSTLHAVLIRHARGRNQLRTPLPPLPPLPQDHSPWRRRLTDRVHLSYVIVRLVSGKTLEVQLDGSTEVKRLKSLIQQRVTFKSTQLQGPYDTALPSLQLIFEGIVLLDTESLLFYGIKNADVIHVVFRGAKNYSASELAQPINITVKTLTGDTLPLSKLPSASVYDLKLDISYGLSIPVDEQRLTYQGFHLLDDNYLSDWEWADGAVVHLVQRSTGTVTASPNDSAVGVYPENRSSAELKNNPVGRDVVISSYVPWRTFAESMEALEQIDACFQLSSKRLAHETIYSEDTRSTATFVTARSRASNTPLKTVIDNEESAFMKAIRGRCLIPELGEENDWSGRGQHVEFIRSEPIPLKIEHVLGHSATALVQQVRCRRIILARKSMECNQVLTIDQALNEVEHLQNLHHSHIVRLVGTYLQGTTFALLIYPVAEWNLKSFMQNWSELHDAQNTAFCKFFGCLTHAVAYIHSHTTRHMDIKPMNILVKRRQGYFHVYLADFDVAINFRSEDQSQTDTPRKRTFMYAAPEVIAREPKGRKSDIFSLGCVYVEMLTVAVGMSLEKFEVFRYDDESETRAYHATLTKVQQWLDAVQRQSLSPTGYRSSDLVWPLNDLDTFVPLISSMLLEDPVIRPSAAQVAEKCPKHLCCQEISESYVYEGSNKDENSNEA